MLNGRVGGGLLYIHIPHIRVISLRIRKAMLKQCSLIPLIYMYYILSNFINFVEPTSRATPGGKAFTPPAAKPNSNATDVIRPSNSTDAS